MIKLSMISASAYKYYLWLAAPPCKIYHNRSAQHSYQWSEIKWCKMVSDLPIANNKFLIKLSVKRISSEQGMVENEQKSFPLDILTFTSWCVKAITLHVRSALLRCNSSTNMRPTCLTRFSISADIMQPRWSQINLHFLFDKLLQNKTILSFCTMINWFSSFVSFVK